MYRIAQHFNIQIIAILVFAVILFLTIGAYANVQKSIFKKLKKVTAVYTTLLFIMLAMPNFGSNRFALVPSLQYNTEATVQNEETEKRTGILPTVINLLVDYLRK